MKNHQKGRLVIISAPSGAGKGTIIAEILKKRPELQFSISATTRSPRPNERHGVEYFFLTKEQFKDKIKKNQFLEYAMYIGNHYGTPIEPIEKAINEGKTILLDIEVIGAKKVMEKMPDALTIFIVPPSLEELERRLRGRATDSEEILKARLERAKEELNEKSRYKYVVVNDTVSHVVDEILNIIDRKD